MASNMKHLASETCESFVKIGRLFSIEEVQLRVHESDCGLKRSESEAQISGGHSDASPNSKSSQNESMQVSSLFYERE